MPILPDIGAPGLNIAIVRKRRPPYGFQPVPAGPKVRLGRKPSAMELRLLSLIDIPIRLDTETDTLREAFVVIRREQLASATIPGEIRDATAEYAAAIESGQRRTGQYGAFELRRECSRQGVSFDLTTEFPVTGEAVAVDAATRTQVWAAKLQREWAERVAGAEVRLRSARPFATPAEWRDYAGKGLEIGLKIVARAVVNRSFGAGRLFELKRMKKEDEFEPSMLVFTAILDANTCDECEDADGTTFLEDSDDADIMAVPYYLCESAHGPENLCRCMWVSLGPQEADLIVDHVESVLNLDSESWREWEEQGGDAAGGDRATPPASWDAPAFNVQGKTQAEITLDWFSGTRCRRLATSSSCTTRLRRRTS